MEDVTSNGVVVVISILLGASSKLSLFFHPGRGEEGKGTWEKAQRCVGGYFYRSSTAVTHVAVLYYSAVLIAL